MLARVGRIAAASVAVVFAVVLLLVAGLYGLAMTGIGTERLRQEAEASIRQFTGIDVTASMGAPQVSVDASRFLGIALPDVSLVTSKDGAEIIEAGALRFGIRFKPLMSGEFKLGSLGIEDARIVPAAIGARGPRDWKAGLVNEQGLIEPDLLAEAVFRAARRAFGAFQDRQTYSVDFRNVELVLPPTLPFHSIMLREVSVTQEDDLLLLHGLAELDGQPLTLDGRVEMAQDGARVEKLDIELAAERFAVPLAGPGGEEAAAQVTMAVKGGERGGGEAKLSATVTIDDAAIGGDPSGPISGSGILRASISSGSGKIEVERALFRSGRTRLDFNGAIGPAPVDADADAPVYRFELVSNNSVLAPDTSPEPALTIGARLAGTYDAVKRQLVARQIGVRTGPGEILAQATVTFARGMAPALDFAMTIPEMPVAHAKQIWPWLAARGARLWTLRNVYGGTLRDSSLRIVVPAGRMGNGIPFSGEEMWGQFKLVDSRFDVAGRIPAVRDANGSVNISGTDIDILLQSGTVFMSSGRTVRAGGGTFLLRNAHEKPLVGRLDMAVSGEAAAVIELSSYDPINATRRLGIEPGDFTSGTVEGRVRADIPLQKDASFKNLDWQVSLDYENLAIARPFEGQKVSDAKGSIDIDPTRAVIEADARLNGVPAEISMVNPLGGSDVARERRVRLSLDDKSRDTLAPGLAALVSGPFTVELVQAGESGQSVTVDLERATLSLPWIGWTKGPGIAAEAHFELVRNQRSTLLSDFRLDGSTFGAQGEIRLAEGALAEAEFSGARLNRDDDFSLAIARKGRGYDVSVRGNAVDARSIIKLALSEAGSGASGGGEPTPVSVDARLARVVGFGGEELRDATITYSGQGSAVDKLQVDALTASGARVEFDNTASGGTRTVSMASPDAGEVLRFVDIYDKVRGGRIALELSGPANGALQGRLTLNDFVIVNEPRLGSLVSTAPAGDNRSLSDAVRRDIDTSQVSFERGFARIDKGRGYLKIANGVLRGPLIGTTFQGTVYDRNRQMELTGTFMPAYGLNRLFGEIPLLGAILGNGRDRGLIGITYKLTGDWQKPDLQVNPLSVIAPGIFRQIFEYN